MFGMNLTYYRSTDFPHVMDFLENHKYKDDYPFDKQCLVILDHVLPATSNPSFSTKSKLLQNIIISERSSVQWQLYVAKDLGKRDHFGCPTSNVIHLIESLQMIQPNLSFTFIPERCPVYKSPMFRISSFMPSPDDEVATFMSLLLKTSLPDFPTTSSTSKRGSALAHSIGLQYQCANQHHLSRFCQNNNSIPSVNLGSPFSSEAKRHLLHVSLSVLEKEKEIFENANSPFALVNVTDETYVETRIELKQSLVSYLDPSGDVLKQHIDSKVSEFPDNATLRMSKGLLGRHNDDLNGKAPDDNTLSLHAPTQIDSLFDANEMLPSTRLSKFIPKSGRVRGKVAPNFLLYTRKIASNYAFAVSNRAEYLSSEQSCPLARLVMRLLLTCQKPIDYQGFIFEREESFSTFADRMSSDRNHVSSKVTQKHFHTLASFDKMGFLSIVLHVFFSLHYHGVIMTEDDSIDYCIYFGCFCNGTVQLVRVWLHILANRVVPHGQSRPVGDGQLFRLLERADLKVYLTDKASAPVDRNKWNSLTGNSLIPRFQFNHRGPPAIKRNLQLIRVAIKKIVKYREATPDLSNQDLHEMFFTEMSKFNGIGPMRCNQLFSSLCLTGLFPIQAMADCICLSVSTNPGKILNAYVRPHEASIEIALETLLKCLKLHGFNRLTHFFLENMLCEMYRHLDEDTKQKLRDTKLSDDFFGAVLRKGLEMPEYLERVVNATKSAKSDVYFKDTCKDEWQHLFSIVERKNTTQLEMRPSTSMLDAHNRSGNVKIHVDYDKNRNLVVDSGPKHDLKLHFV